MMAGVYSSCAASPSPTASVASSAVMRIRSRPRATGSWATCSCGAHFERWVTEQDAEADLLRSALLAFEN